MSATAASVRWTRSWRWESVVAVVAIVAAVAAFWVTIDAGFLAHRDWLAVQKTDFILGPIFVGLYWRHRRPHNRFGLLLIALGLLGVLYIGESSSSPLLYTVGVSTEYLLWPMMFAVILAFPSGRLDGLAERSILAGVLVGLTFTGLVWLLTLPLFVPGFSLSGCGALCPSDPLQVWATPSWLFPLSTDVARSTLVAASLAIAGLLVWRFLTGTPPRRRALAIGAPIALLYLVAQATYQTQQLINPHDADVKAEPLTGPFQWTIAAGTSAVWYGFLFALIAAELFAGRTLRRLVRDSMGRPSLGELESIVRGPLGDPGLRLGFWRSRSREWADADGAVLAPPRSDQSLSEFDRDGRPAVAIVHDAQLSEDPELLRAAGAVALLALENVELDSAWKESLGELADSRARLVRAGNTERRKLERDLHDGAQQRLLALQGKLQVAQTHADRELAEELGSIRIDAIEAVEELRALARGIYPPVLRERGVASALRSVAMTAPIPISVHDEGIGRFEVATEAAIYFCALEAIQNTIKHAGDHLEVTITLERDPGHVRFTVADNGVGFNAGSVALGMGLTDIRDRIGAVGGDLELTSSPGHGTVIRGTVPDPNTRAASRRTHPREGQADTADRLRLL